MTGDLDTTDVRAITVRQPWAWSIEAASADPDAKLIENRSGGAAGWKHRGLLFIHAGERWSDRGADDPRVLRILPPAGIDRGRLLRESHRYADERWHGFRWGAVIAVAHLEDIHLASGCCAPWGEQRYTTASGHLVDQVTHLILADVRRLEDPVPARGMLGLWRPPAEVTADVLAQLPDLKG